MFIYTLFTRASEQVIKSCSQNVFFLRSQISHLQYLLSYYVPF